MKSSRPYLVLALTTIGILSAVANIYSSAGVASMSPLDGADEQEWVSIGPDGGNVMSLVVDPVNNNIVYAGTNGSMFKSTNGGVSWTAINSGLASNGPRSLNIRSLVIDPSAPSTIYAGTLDGVYKSTNSGMDWNHSLDFGSVTRIRAMAIDPFAPSKVYVSIEGAPFGGVYKTTNAGESWTTVGCCLQNDTVVNVLVTDHFTPETIYAGNNLGEFFKSTDGAFRWTKLSKIGVNLSVQTLAQDPLNSDTIYAGTDSGLFKSINGGISWTEMNPLTTRSVQSIQIDSLNPNNAYAATAGSGVFKTTDAGMTWSAMNSGLTDLGSQIMAVAPSSPTILYTGTGVGGVFKSVDAASSWVAANKGLCNFNVLAIAIHPVTRNIIYIGTRTVFKSIDAGTTWIPVNSGLDGSHILALTIDTTAPDTIYAGTTSGVFKSIDGGQSWNTLLFTSVSVLDVAVDPAMPNIVYAGTVNGLFKSTDSGANWAISNSGLTNSLIRSVALDPSNSAVVYVGTSHGQVFKSTNRGTTWIRLTDIPVDSQVWITIHPYTSNIIYAGLGGFVYKTTDGGATWNQLTVGSNLVDYFKVTIDPISPDTIYVGGVNGGGGVFRSVDGGAHWSDVTTRSFTPDIQAVAINPTAPGNVYVGTRGGGVLKRSFGDHIDNTPPAITCPADLNVVADRDSCSTVVHYTISATDDSGVVSVATDIPSGSAFPIGTTTINAVASDAAGNSSSCSFTVTVTNPNPVVTISGPASGSVFPVHTPVSFSGTFSDAGGGLHSAEWTFDSFGQPATVQAATVAEPNDSSPGTISAYHTFTIPGVYLVSLLVNDSCSGFGSSNTVDGLTAMVVIYDPDGGFVTGGGWIDSPTGAYVSNPTLTGKAVFGFQSKYANGASLPTGSTEFRFQVADFKFTSISYDWLVIAGARAQYKGSGTVNGVGNFGFLLTAIDGQTTGGGGVDKFGIKIWDKNNGDAIVYDNQLGATDNSNPTTVAGGSIRIKKQ